MKKIITLLVSISMMFSLCCISSNVSADEEETNYLTNGDFENDIWGSNSGWSVSTDSWDGLTVDMKTDAFKDGEQSVHYYSTNATNVTLSQDVSLEAGTYTLTAYAMGSNASPSISVADKEQTGELTGWNNWNAITTTFTIDSDQSVTVALKTDIAAEGWGYFDAVTLVKGEAEIVIPTNTNKKVTIKKINGLSDDFMCGVDISSVISEENSGVKYYNTDGEEEDLFKILSDAGVNYIRVRIWNDPKTSDGKYYGGGNNDINTAVEIAKRAAAYNMKLYADFQYSDFWASPGEQTVPKAWKGLSTASKASKIKSYTTSCLKKLGATGVTIGMVSVGNETSGFFCGSKNWKNMCTMFNAGCKAVRSYSKKIKIMIHFAGSSMKSQVKYGSYLKKYKVDYDVLGISWYAFYSTHGSLTNMKKVMNEYVTKYNKQIVIAENSYPVRFDDSDGSPETFGDDDYVKHYQGSMKDWNISVQGQATQVRDIIAAVASVKNKKGIGYFYWEPAWITVGDTTGLTGDEWQKQYDTNLSLWEEYGSGWASSYAAEYRKRAAVYHGGSSWDNQAMFDTKGKAYDSINVFKYVYTGQEGDEVSVLEEYDEPEVELKLSDNLEADNTTDADGNTVEGIWSKIWWNNVNCKYSDKDNKEWTTVKRWVDSDCQKVIKAYKNGKTGVYTIHGIMDEDEHSLVTMKVSITADESYIKSAKLSYTSYTYDGKSKKPSVTIVDKTGKKLVKNTDYTVTYESSVSKVGTYEVVINGIGVYSFTKTLTYKIVPKGTSVDKLTAGKNLFYITYKKQSKYTNGYEVEYSTKSTFTKSTTLSKKYSVSSSLKHKITGLKAKKKYYVRVRTYYVKDDETYYSKWSSKKTVTVK